MIKTDSKIDFFNIREDWTLFRNLNTLTQKAGVSIQKIPKIIAKELADNALDSCSTYCETGFLNNGGFFIEDNGNGIKGSNEEIADLFSISRPLKSTKLYRIPTRGALGNGLRVVAGAVLSTNGKLKVYTNNRILNLIPLENGKTKFEVVGEYGKPGTRIEIDMPGHIRYDCLDWAKRAIRLAGKGEEYKGKTSAYWYDSDSFYELLKTANTELSVRDFIMQFEGASGRVSGKIAGGFLGRRINSLSREESEKLLYHARENTRPVIAKRLGYVGELADNDIKVYIREETGFYINPNRGNITAEIPVVIEVWLKQTEMHSGRISINRTPISSDIHNYTYQNYFEIFGSGLYYSYPKKVDKYFVADINIITPFMPITSDGKAPDFQILNIAISNTLEKTFKKLRAITRKTSIKIYSKSQKGVILENLEGAINKVSGNGKYRYSIRQLYYAIRPLVLEEIDKELSYENFQTVITNYENNSGKDLPGIYRDARGILYHPHINEDIPLCTKSVEAYTRPEWKFNKILYSEKEGFFEILKNEKWPEKHDCALLTSKGFASRATRDVIDLLGNTDEPLYFFCIHDADAYGTLIYQSLVEETKARPGRSVEIINLGLEPWEGKEMGLEIEKIESSKRDRPVARYISGEWKEWLQSNRIELNAMDTPTFIEWLNEKMSQFTGKVIPPKPVIQNTLYDVTKDNLRETIIAQILQKVQLDEKVEKKYMELLPNMQNALETIELYIQDELLKNPTAIWNQPIYVLSNKIIANFL